MSLPEVDAAAHGSMDSRELLNARDGLLLASPDVLDFRKALNLSPDMSAELCRSAAAQIVLHCDQLLARPVQLQVALVVNLIADAENC